MLNLELFHSSNQTDCDFSYFALFSFNLVCVNYHFPLNTAFLNEYSSVSLFHTISYDFMVVGFQVNEWYAFLVLKNKCERLFLPLSCIPTTLTIWNCKRYNSLRILIIGKVIVVWNMRICAVVILHYYISFIETNEKHFFCYWTNAVYLFAREMSCNNFHRPMIATYLNNYEALEGCECNHIFLGRLLDVLYKFSII